MEAKIDEFIIFMVAGQETTSNALALAFLELGRNPHVLEKLNQEINSVLANKPTINAEDLSKLEYTSCVFKESMRMWPPIPTFFRTNPEEITLNGYRIPRDSLIQVNFFIIFSF
jgi:cytochrome P450